MKSKVYQNIPVFPLPEIVLFPYTIIPLHIYENRYREMLEHTLKHNRLLVLVGYKPGWEEDYLGSPPVFEIAGLGTVALATRLPDGRYNILVEGKERVRITNFGQHQPFRLADLEVLIDKDCQQTEITERHKIIDAYVRHLMARPGVRSIAVGKITALSRDPHQLTERLAAALIAQTSQRQRFLETLDPLTRMDILIETLGDVLLALDDSSHTKRMVN